MVKREGGPTSATRLWRRHPGVRAGSDLTRGERASDRIRNGMGSWTFIAGVMLFLAGSMIRNGSRGFDPYPFILLNLILSCVAALQGAILLIAARRSDQVSAELALRDFETNREALEVARRILERVTADPTSPAPSEPGEELD